MDETQAHAEPRTATSAVSLRGERQADYFKESEACIKHKS